MDRHLLGEAHKIALMLDNRQNPEQRLDTSKRPVQPDIRESLNDSGREAFKKLMRTAYEMAITPSMPHKHFKVLVKCQRANGVRLVEGKDGGHAAREFIHCIAGAIKEKCVAIIASSHFMSILSDGSQARKTKDEKELVLVRTARNGIPVYFVVSLLEMSDLGGANADSIKAAIDGIFCEGDGKVQGDPVPLGDYKTKVVCATADGANVNVGVYSGVLTRMKNEREWLVTIHCVNHRLELALKDVVKGFKPFKKVDDFYKDVWSLLKNSGKLKAEIKKSCEALNITHYEFSKIHGTRFLNHRRRGFAKLLNNWPALTTAFNNALAANKGYRPETKAKLTGFLKKLRSYQFLCHVAGYLDVLETLGPLSLVFERSELMAYEMPASVEKTMDALEEISQACIEDLPLSSYLAKYKIAHGHENTLRANFPKAGHEKRKPQNREYIDVHLEQMTDVDFSSIEKAVKIRKDAAKILRPKIDTRFSTYDQEIFGATVWLDPKLWDNSNKMYGNAEINRLCVEFDVPLTAAGFEKSKIFDEWRSVKILQRSLYSKMECLQFWEKMLGFRREEFPNMALLVELALCMSGSNSSVERCFNILSLVLSDRRLGMSHDMMEKCMIIASNDKNWSREEKAMVINRAVDAYMQKRRTAVFTSKNTDAENIASTNALAQCSAMEDNSGSDDSDSDFNIESESSCSDSEENDDSME